MSPTRTAQTRHGDVAYETVECDSCGNECLASDAVPFTIGDRSGKACPHCESEGPISFPERAKGRLINGVGSWDGDGVLPILLLFPMLALLTPLAALSDGDGIKDEAQGFGIAIMGAVLWGIVVYMALLLFL